MFRDEPVKILFAGGCHVVGYPAGKDHAFPEVVRAELLKCGIRSRIECIGYLPLHHEATVAAACRRMNPDILVLQLMNYELGNELSAFVRLRLGLRPKRKKRFLMGHLIPHVNKRRRLLTARVKQLIDTLLGHRLVDFQSVAARLETFMSAVACCGVPHVVFASPTPCFDPAALYYRRRAVASIQAVLSHYRCAYLDLLPLAAGATESWLEREGFFADSIHLGVAGQTAVGRLIAEHLKVHILGAETAAATTHV